jgi:predicted ATPase
MLRQISVSNLGCFDDQVYKVDFSEETLLAGPNNSGKSMLLNGMNILRWYLVTGNLHWNSPYYNLQNFVAAVNAHDPNKKIQISITIEGDNFDLWMSGDRIERCMLNNSVINPHSRPAVDILKKIWCFSPNRSLVPFQSQVQQSAGPIQPLRPNGSNVNNFLLERWTDRDKNWDLAESWLKKIDSDMSQLKTPIRGNQVSLETLFGNTSINVSLQGSGFQSAAAIVSAIVFSPKGSTVVLEEPEVFLHPNSQEVIVDMINEAVNSHGKQVIFSTHSCNILLPFFSDIGQDAPQRGKGHIYADPNKFSMWTFEKVSGKVSIKPYPLHKKTFRQFRDDFKYIWG